MDRELTTLLEPDKRTLILLQNIAKIGSALVIALGMLCLIGWQFNISFLINFFPNVVGMNPLSAVGFIAGGGSLLLQLNNATGKKVLRDASCFLSGITFIIGCAVLVNYMTSIQIQFDQVLFTDKLLGNRISPHTGLSFIFAGAALFLFNFPLKRYFIRIGQIINLLAALISMLAIIGYSYQSLSLYTLGATAPMPLSSAFTSAILCIAMLFAQSNHGITKVLTRNTPSSMLAFHLIIITLTLPAALGYLRIIGEHLQLFDTQTGVALLVVGNMVFISIIIWLNTVALQKAEIENLIIKNELKKKNITLQVNAKDLASKIVVLEGEKQAVYDKFTSRNKLLDLVDSM